MKLIFVVGNSRSGTTMMGRVLNQHSEIHTFDELHFFEHQVDVRAIHEQQVWSNDKLLALIERLITTEREYRHFFAKVVQGKYRQEADAIISRSAKDPVSVYKEFLRYESANHDKSIACEQTPRYLFYVNELLDIFPEAYVINLVRDPRDVLYSQKNKWRRRRIDSRRTPLSESIRAWANYHPYTITRLWLSAVRKASTFTKHKRFISIRFEDVINQPEDTIRTICSFINVNFEPNMLRVSQIGSSVGEDKPDTLGISSNMSGRWKDNGLTNTELAICQKVAAGEMKKYGYEPITVNVSVIRIALSMLVFMLKISLAILLNLNRTKNLVDTVRRRMLVGADS